MRHVPHVYVPGPWTEPRIALDEGQLNHLVRVLRRAPGSALTYTDGDGTFGRGELRDEQLIRGDEVVVPEIRPAIRIAVAPPADRARQRFLVEKLGELGVAELIWLETKWASGRAPRHEKVLAWTIAAVEQSRGSHRMRVAGPVELAELPPAALWVAERENGPPQRVTDGDIIAIGPEGGLDPGEVPAGARKFGLGRRILRVETAAIAAATLFLDRSGHLRGPAAAT